jgi:diguanylate cyclase (GGDEF)-like protein
MQSSPRLLLDNAADKLPSPSGVALAVMELWEREDTTAEQLARLIQTDPALCGRLLRLANSSIMGTRPVAAVPEAVVRVGMRTVGQLAVCFSLIDNSMQGHCDGFDYEAFWSESLLMAVLSKGLAEATRLAAPDDLFACGLLARIGELALATIYPREYAGILRDGRRDLAARTREQFGFDHNELSYELMLDYGVPDALAEPARHHQDADDDAFDHDSRHGRLTSSFRLAYQLARLTGEEDARRVTHTRVIETLGERLELTRERVAATFDAAVSDWHDWSRLLSLPAEFSADYASAASAGDAGEQPADANATAYRAALLGDERLLSRTRVRLEEAGFDLRHCADFDSARRVAVAFLPQLFVIDGRRDDGEAWHFCRLLRSTEWGAAAYILVVAHDHSVDCTELFAAGADMVISDATGDAEFAARLGAVSRYLRLQEDWQRDRAKLLRIANELAMSHHKVEQLSLTDQLTQLPNRRFAMQAMERAWNLSTRSQLPMTLVMIDLDHFKTINDRYGHAGGDEVLRQAARVMQNCVRREESVCRVGGEEFLLISTGSELKPMLVAGERLRRTLAATAVQHGEQVIRPTMSLGIVERSPDDASADDLLTAADKALYLAKHSGRNCIAYRHGGRYQALPRR